jgi:hypothetical protein
MTSDRASFRVLLAAACSAGAGLVHAAAAGTHAGDPTLVRLFAATALVQTVLAAAVLVSRSRSVVVALVGANAVALVAWVLSRATGIPMIQALAEPESVGTQDLAAAALAAGAVAAGLLALVTSRAPAASGVPRWLSAMALVAVAVPAFAGLASAHEHRGEGHADDGGHSHGATGSASTSEASPFASDPLLAGADTSHATEAQLTAAVDLVETTRAGTSVQLTTTAAAEAAGYVWIGDGRRVGGFQHYVSRDLLDDGKILDPDAVESLVFQNTEAGPVLVSAMYLLEPGSTMDDVPDVAGDLTVWHDHQNLCWDPSGQRLAGVVVNGTCRPGGVQRGTTPMLHVWLTDHECGPFSGIEGHGDGCASHEH